MLLRNGSSLGSGPGRHFGASFVAVCLPNHSRSEQRMGFYGGHGTSDGAGDSIADKSGFPNGYGMEGGFFPPIKDGGMSSHREADGQGSLAAFLEMAKEMTAAIGGTGNVTEAVLSLIVQLAAALSGSGTVSEAAMQAVANLAAALSGTGDIPTAALNLLVALESSLSGSGDVDGNLKGIASLYAAITVTGDALSTANVGLAVWSQILETNGVDPLTASRILRIVAAAVAGRVSGGPGSPAFRNLSNTIDQIIGAADSNGNRTSATYGA